ncbi:hypothetical protein [Methylobacterium sp. 22177]|uniref:hypothetical protein n=1 Tax=Methylobacterium sp. 22177 TaxID=3453885 RepID=UPI003F83D7FB
MLTGAVDSVIALSKFDVPSDCRTSGTAEIAPPTYRVLTGMRLTNQTAAAAQFPAGEDRLVVFDDDLTASVCE